MVRVVLPLPLPPLLSDELSSGSLEQPASSPVASAATTAMAPSLRDRRVLVRIASSCCLTCRPPGQLHWWRPLFLAAARAGNVRDVYVSGTVGALPQVMC